MSSGFLKTAARSVSLDPIGAGLDARLDQAGNIRDGGSAGAARGDALAGDESTAGFAVVHRPEIVAAGVVQRPRDIQLADGNRILPDSV